METCSKDQANEYAREFAVLRTGNVAGPVAVAVQTELPPLTDEVYDKIIWPCGD